MPDFLSKKTSSKVHARSNGVRSRRTRGIKVPNSQPKSLIVGKKNRQEQRYQELTSLGERLKRCIPNDPNTFLFVLVIIAYLVCGVINFIHTGNALMLENALRYVSAYAGFAGLPKVTPLLPWVKKEKGDP